MKLRVGRFALVLITCCFLTATVLMAAQTAPAAVNTGTVTVGDFVVRLADALNPSSHRDIKSLDQAKQFLSSQGIVLPGSLNLTASLTQADVATLTSLFGVNVETSEPSAQYSGQAVDGFLGYLRDGLQNGRIPRQGADGGPAPTLSINSAGACCQGLTCTTTDIGTCNANGGIWRSDGLSCTPNPCGPEYAKCCIDRHNCQVTTFAGCNSLGGIYTGEDSCAPPGIACKNPVPSVTPTEP